MRVHLSWEFPHIVHIPPETIVLHVIRSDIWNHTSGMLKEIINKQMILIGYPVINTEIITSFMCLILESNDNWSLTIQTQPNNNPFAGKIWPLQFITLWYVIDISMTYHIYIYIYIYINDMSLIYQQYINHISQHPWYIHDNYLIQWYNPGALLPLPTSCTTVKLFRKAPAMGAATRLPPHEQMAMRLVLLS